MKGYLDAKVVKAVVFWVITACIVLTVTCLILMVWEVTDPEVLRRAMITSAVLTCGCLFFQGLNLAFGTIETRREQSSLFQATQVGDQLRRAKDSANDPHHSP